MKRDPTTGLRERKKHQTRRSIVEAAGRLFSTHGFAATTMEEIAAASSVSPGTLYNYFGTKNTILLAHVESHIAAMMDAGAAVLAKPPADAGDAVQMLAQVYLDQLIELERGLLREVFAAGFGPSPDLLPELIRFDELLADQLGALMRHFSATGDLDPGIEIDEAVTLLYSLVFSQLIVYVSVEHIEADTLRRDVARQIEVAFSGLRAQER
jgi:AcrR family transcriptional regulator